MASTRTVVRQNRALDSIYDPIYTVSGNRPLYRQNVPSSGHTGPATQGTAVQTRQVSLDDSVQGANRPKYFKRPLVSLNNVEAATVVLDRRSAQAAREMLPSRGESARVRSAAEYKAAEEADDAIQPHSRTVGIQTMYRDGEAQTEPYTPDFVLPPGEEPEVLQIADMRFNGEPGSRLPPGQAEMEAIDVMRRRRAIERSLPPMTDEASFEVRKRLMRRLELEAWKHRERAEDDANERLVSTVMDAVKDVVRQREYVTEQRLEETRIRIEAERDASIAAVEQRRIKQLRNLSKNRQTSEARADALTGTGTASLAGALAAAAGPGKGKGKRSQRDIVGEYANYGSNVYAPVRRFGRQQDKQTTANKYRLELHAPEPERLDELDEFEHTLPSKTLKARTKRPAQPKPTSNAERKDAAISQDLERVHTMLRSMGTTSEGTNTAITPQAGGRRTRGGGAANVTDLGPSSLDEMNLPSWRKPKVKIQRPNTPTFEVEDEGEETDLVQNAVLLLQKLIRGRAAQNMMFEGKERRLELIQEMRLDLLTAEERAQIEETEAEMRHNDAVKLAARSTLDMLAGEIVGATHDQLAHGLVREQEMARINAHVAQAQETRRRREAEEGGQRQAEQNLRQRRDLVYRHLYRVHQETAQNFIDSILRSAVEEDSLKQAEESIGISASNQANTATAGDAHAENVTGTSVVRDLVGSFLLPNVERTHIENAVAQEERKYVESARQILAHVNKSVLEKSK